MKKIFPIFYLLFISCNQNSSEAEKQYIKNLEQKNAALEQQLQDEKNKPPIVIEKKQDVSYTPQEMPTIKDVPKNYFTIGSTEEEVLDVMGDPTSIEAFESSNSKWFYYGFSVVKFKDGRVNSYDEVNRKLKIKVAKIK